MTEKKYFSINDLDKKLEKIINKSNGFYVELGANDGITQSNTAYFEKNLGWKGVLIEPIPHNFLKCIKNRSDENRIFCNACVSFDYEEKFVEIIYSNLMSIAVDLESDIENRAAHAEAGLKHIHEKTRSFAFGAKARTLNDILIEAEAPSSIDLLSLDVEGAEIEVLKGVDHDRFRFEHLLVECRDAQKMINFLADQDYTLKEKLSFHDYLFVNARKET